jgi:FHA domain
MTDQLLSVFKICLLVLLYLFFARVLWAVWSEVRSPKRNTNPNQAAHQPHVVVGSAPSAAAGQQHQPIMQTTSPPSSLAAQIPTERGGRRGSKATMSTKVPRSQVSKMVVIEPRSRKGAAFAIGNELTIGRSAGCTVSITDDEFISQLHARAFVDGGQVFVEDLGSTNGSYHNGHRLTTLEPLRKGDRLQIGNTVLEAH